ncbi:mitochondrial carrier domain-containing protein [Aspergillus cavernicola]|uniref:Mitochondrial carrier domain-containing protein n=1 Tax=Aspergillus cavernicola TaxID=176166 RepID=A0ABR4HF16_9EURO
MAHLHASPWEGVASSTTAAILASIIVYPLGILQVQVQQRNQQEATDPEKRPNTSEIDAHYDSAIDAICHILREEGILGLYSGLGSSILGTASMNFAYFYWSTVTRGIQQSTFRRCRISDANSIGKELGLGAVSGARAQLCTNPIAIISTRQQTCQANDEKRSMWQTLKGIVQSKEGWTGLWTGGLLALIRGKSLGSADAFLLGALSKVLATVTTHPLIVTKTMLQSKPPTCRKGKPFSGCTEVLLYIGLAPQIFKGFLVQGLIMVLKERYVSTTVLIIDI